jgi:hypothetical protein
MNHHGKRLPRVGSLLLTLALAVICAQATPRGLAAEEQRSHQLGVIIALGFGHVHEARPTFSMVQRVLTAVDLYHRKVARHILFSGGYTTGHVAEAEEMAIMAMAYGVPAKAIWVENASNTTGDNARYSEYLIDRHRVRSAALVTHSSHMERARKAFLKIPRLRTIDRYHADDAQIPIHDLSYDEELPKSDEFDAIMLHATSRVREFPFQPLGVPPDHVDLARTAGDLHQRGYVKPVYIWHRAFAAGHITRAEVIGIAAVAFGVPQKWLVYSPSRRNAAEKQSLFEFAVSAGWIRVLVVIPRHREKEADKIIAQYAEHGIIARVILAGRPTAGKRRGGE